MKLKLGFSPCPNDTFIFDALIHHKIDTEGLEFEVFYDDVETLNHKAFAGELDITKLSYHAFAYAVDKYVLLDAGSALGFGVGPLLISDLEISISDLEKGSFSNNPNPQPQTSDLRFQISSLSRPASGLPTPASEIRIGIPGKFTTANFLLSLAFPNSVNKKEIVFSGIEDALLNNDIDVGLIIHENRFTYQNKGLKKIIDLGDYWEQQTGCAIPLGGIVVNRKLPLDVQLKVNRLVRQSVEYALANPKSGLEYIRSHAQEMSEEVMYKHIELYVNKYSVDLGVDGRKAIELLFATAQEKNIVPAVTKTLFLT